MSTINSNNVLVVDLSALTADDIQSLDIETALLAVNMNRVSALDDQLRTQMEGVQAKNDQMALLTTLQNNLNAVMNGLPSNMTDTTILGDNLDNQVGLEETVNDSMQAAQVQLFKTSDGEYRIGLLSSGDSYEGGINRNVTKAEELAALGRQHQSGQVPVQGLGYDQLQSKQFDVVFNATSASLTAQLPPLPVSAFAPGALAYELAYGKGLTPFLRLAQQAGVTRLADGVGMLAEQAAEAFLWWRGVRPDTQGVIRQLTVPLV